MAGPRPVLVPSISYRDSFQDHLKQIERRNWEDKIFYLPSDIRTWMNAKSPPESYSNVVGLLSNLYGDGFAKIEADHCTDYLLVLATLLHPDVNCGNLIHVFTRCTFSDHMLPRSDTVDLYKSILDDLESDCPMLPNSYRQYDYEAVISAFDIVRWAFCPVSLGFAHECQIPLGPCILPFFYKKVVNEKGGTANVHHYKIQEDLVESNQLKRALASSKHEDPKFGRYYEFAVKTYVAGWNDIYKFESEAFRAVRTHKGVVKYLGEYHLREGADISPNHNIILEYGQQDLDEYLADTYPPVLTTEIIAFWEDLFKVADTIRQLHQLQYTGEDGRTQHFKGWHGDIKPDNILRVRKEFKLADFGFTKFEKDEIGKSSTLILGAPECDNQREGTITPHLQTIDTWSFGCVLSAVATWAILGSQAYDHYRQVRKLEISRLRQNVKENKVGTAPSGDDAFHDGKKVLPSVIHWHNFLRNSSRKADTISHRVLHLVETRMLRARPSDRLGFEQLCTELKEIILLAKNEHLVSLERGYLKEVHPDTLEALLQLDKIAPPTATPTSQVNTTQIVTPSTVQGQDSGSLLPQSQSQLRPTSDRVRKSERLDRIVVAKTANREEAINSTLKLSIVDETTELCDSPQQGPIDAGESSFGARSTVNQSASIDKGKGVDVPEIYLTTGSPVAAHTGGFSAAVMSNGPFPGRPIRQPGRSPGPSMNGSGASPFVRSEPIPLRQPQLQRGMRPEAVHKPRKERTVQPTDRAPAREPPLSPPMSSEKGTAQGNDDARPPTVQTPDTGGMTSLSYETPAIFREHTELKNLWTSGSSSMGAFTSFFSKGSKGPREDPWLKNFISHRDIVFVVDNAISMKPHWVDVEMVLETLAMKIGPLDKDGLDLLYTIGQAHNVQEAKGWDIPNRFERSMGFVGREIDSRYQTNMSATLQKIFDGYLVSKRMTLIILTDGLWEHGASDHDVEDLICRFITDLKMKLKKWESRWFSIQFISFGNNEVALRRLQDLDDNLPIKDDVIDTKPWWHPKVDELILGSMTDGGDKATSSLSPQSLSPGVLHTSTSGSNYTLPAPPERTPSRNSNSKRNRLSKFVTGKK